MRQGAINRHGKQLGLVDVLEMIEHEPRLRGPFLDEVLPPKGGTARLRGATLTSFEPQDTLELVTSGERHTVRIDACEVDAESGLPEIRGRWSSAF